MDAALHAARLSPEGQRATSEAHRGDLPSGAMVARSDAPGRALLLRGGLLHRWSHDGYRTPGPAQSDAPAIVLMARSTTLALGAGSVPRTALMRVVPSPARPVGVTALP